MNKKNEKILLILAVIVFACVLVMFCLVLMRYWPYWFGLQKWSIYASVNVTDRGGFDLNGTALTFGKIELLGSSTRYVNFTNGYNFPVFVKISANGNIAPLLSYENLAYVKEGEIEKIGISAVAKNDTRLGFYEGYVNFKVVPAQ